jgi:hypothetical protein
MPICWATRLAGSDSTVKSSPAFSAVDSDWSGDWGLMATSRASKAPAREQLVLVGAQRQVAVGAPAAPVEDDDRRAGLDELVQVTGAPVASLNVNDRACRRPRRTGGDALVEQVLDAPVEHLDHLGRQALGAAAFSCSDCSRMVTDIGPPGLASGQR